VRRTYEEVGKPTALLFPPAVHTTLAFHPHHRHSLQHTTLPWACARRCGQANCPSLRSSSVHQPSPQVTRLLSKHARVGGSIPSLPSSLAGDSTLVCTLAPSRYKEVGPLPLLLCSPIH
jgi:hypothetical protein